jgi:FkbM family methyltransferase
MKALLKKYLPHSIVRPGAVLFYGTQKILYDFRAFLQPHIMIRDIRFSRPFLAGVIVNEHIEITEPWMAELLGYLPIRTKTFLDVGVNVGQTLLSAKAVYPELDYIGFEPNPACIFYVENLIDKNSLTRSRVVPIGLSNSNEVADLWVTKDRPVSSGSTLNKEVKLIARKKARPVALFRLDDIWQQVTNGADPGLLKVDTEGHEPQVLKGALKTIRACQPFILVELLPPRTTGDGEHQERLAIRGSLQQIVDDLGYTIHGIVTSDKGQLRGLRVLPAFPTAVAQKGDAQYCRDYLLSPSASHIVQELLIE